MKYLESEEKLIPSLSLDKPKKDDTNFNSASIISDITNIDLTKLSFFINKFGLKTILSNPSIMGISKEQEAMLLELNALLQFGDDHTEATDTFKPIRY